MRAPDLVAFDHPRGFEIYAHRAIEGLVYLPGFVTEAEEQAFMAHIDRGDWEPVGRRRVQQYGVWYNHSRAADRLEPAAIEPVPDWLQAVAERVVAAGLVIAPVNQVIVNEYRGDQGIGYHTDNAGFGATVAGVSLGDPVVMRFRENADYEHRHALLLERRSCFALSGVARNAWAHGIRKRDWDDFAGVRYPRGRRVSLTLRSVPPAHLPSPRLSNRRPPLV